MLLSPPSHSELNLHQDVLNITEKNRSNPLAWNGQFSPQLIGSLLETYGVDARTIFDPFAGSGTVAAESLRLNKSFFGSEINPAAYLLARIYTLSNIPLSDRVKAFVEVCHAFQASLHNTSDEVIFPATLLKNFSELSCAAKILHSSILLIAFKNSATTTKQQIKRASERVEKIIHSLIGTNCHIHLKLSDARNTGLAGDSCDMVITSPPYINVYNYHQQYRPIVEAMGCKPLEAAPTEIGSNRKHRGNRFLTVIQYCIDLAQVGAEISRVCKHGSRAIIVIGRESNVLGHSFRNADLANEIFTNLIGWNCCLRQERSFTNRFGQKIVEEVLHYITNKPNNIILDIEFARETGVDALKKALKTSGSSATVLLNEAIAKNNLVMPSRMFEPDDAFPPTL